MNEYNETDWMTVNEPPAEYKTKEDYPFQDETYEIIGACMEVHKDLGRGFLEAVYKDALEIVFDDLKIDYEREKKYEILFRGRKLKHFYVADFLVLKDIVLEIKAQNGLVEDHYDQIINYLAVSKCKVGLIVNFGEKSLKFKRVVLSK